MKSAPNTVSKHQVSLFRNHQANHGKEDNGT